MKQHLGFTLIELLVVIGVMAILILAVATGINIPKRFAEANDVRRSQDIEKILNAVNQYIVDHRGEIPPGITTTEHQIGTSVAGCVNLNQSCNVIENSCLDLSQMLNDYLKKMPHDPQNGSNSKTNYAISIDSRRIVTVRACGAESVEELSISM